jgi:hypothetical protein
MKIHYFITLMNLNRIPTLSRPIAVMLIVSLTGIAGCSRFLYKQAYDNVDQILMNRIDHYFNLRSDQEEALYTVITLTHRWHRRNELPRYVRTLTAIQQTITDGWSEEEVQWLLREIKRHRNRLIEKQIPHAAQFLATVNDEQIDHLQMRFDESNEELREKVLRSRDERFTERIERILENCETIFGHLSDEQRKRITALTRTLPETTRARLRYRQTFQRRFIQLLRRRPSAKEITLRLTQWLLQDQFELSPQYAEKMKTWESAFIKMLVALDDIMTSENKRHAVHKVSEWIADLRELSHR